MSRSLARRLGLALLASLLASPSVLAQTVPTYGVTDHISAPDGGFDYASFDPARRRLYLTRGAGVLALDVDAKTVTGHLADAQKAHEALPLKDGTELLITDSGSNSAHLVDAMTGKLLADIATGQKPDAALFDPASGLAMAMNGHSGDITLIDVDARKAVGSIPVGGGLEFAVSDGAGKVYVNVEDRNQIAVVDVKARRVTARWSLKGCEGPTGLAYAPEAGVLISACANKVAKVIRTSDGQDVATLPIGLGPDAVIHDADRHLAFIPAGMDGVLTVVALRGPGDVAIVQTVKTGHGARLGAVDPKTGAIYLPSAKYSPPVGTSRPTAIPGSFELLVVTPAAGQ